MTLFPGATLGSPRFWCRSCCAPRMLSRRLKERIAADEAQGDRLLRDELSGLLAVEEEFQEDRAEKLAA